MIPEQVTEACTNHGEGPIWDFDAGVLRWVDLLAGDVLSLDSSGSVSRLHVGDVAAAVSPRRTGGLVVAVERGFVVVEPDGTVGPVHRAFDELDVRMNDGGCDPRGRFYCGSMAYDMSAGRAGLYRFDSDRLVLKVLDGLAISNGMAWNAEGSLLFYIDSSTARVDVFDYDLDQGEMHDRRPVVMVPPEAGMPDGMTVDAEGGLWVALWGGGAVHRYAPDGRLDAVVELPVSQVTSCAFGGPTLGDLYISTSRMGADPDEQPAAGALFRVVPGVKGLRSAAFDG